MGGRFGWGKNGGTALGDVRDTLGGRAFSGINVAYQISPAKTVIDCSQGSDFYFKLPQTSVVKIGNPTNYDDGTEVAIHILGITTPGSIVWDTLYKTTGALAAFTTAKVRSIGFRYIPPLGNFQEVWRTTGKS